MNSTIEYYNNNSNEFIENTINLNMSDLYKKFEAYLYPGNKILDLGCGSGRDSRYFKTRGYDVVAVDPSEKMCQATRKIADISVLQMKAEDMVFKNKFDGIWACASLLHIKKDEMQSVIIRLLDNLVDGGIIYASWKYGDMEIVNDGKYLCYMTDQSLNNLFAEVISAVVLDIWISNDTQGRNEKWINVLLKKAKTDLKDDAIHELDTFDSSDNRADGDSINELFRGLLKDGCFKEFLTYTRKKPELEICLRGNSSPAQITIYYHNHMVWKLEYPKKKGKNAPNVPKVTISMNHARYCADWEQILDELETDYGFKIKKSSWRIPQKRKDSNTYNICGNGYLSCEDREFDDRFVSGTYKLIRKMMDKFFENSEKIDYFKSVAEDIAEEDAEKKLRPQYVEKIAQQEIYRYFKNGRKINDSDYMCIYDLEFSQKGGSGSNQPDSIGIIYDESQVKKIVFIEVKSTKSALTGTSGLEEHCRGMDSYINSNPAIRNRIIESGEYIKKLKEIGVCQYVGLDDALIADIPNVIKIPEGFEKLIIFTDEAAGILKEEGKETEYKEIAEKYGCKIMIFYYNKEESLSKGYSTYQDFDPDI